MRFFGIAKKAGVLETGEEMAGAAARAKKAKVIFTASDASPNLVKRGDNFAAAGGVPHVRLPYTKEELGAQTGKGSVGIAAVSDVGLASEIVSELAGVDPGKYQSAADILRAAAEREAMRKREALAHKKNVAAGRKKRSVK